ncbi:nephrin-like isoform X2 [Limulus polyphemus]|uniref:Nephrin-like isoform X2 n=1 Tax=Limulus polyphemus TaxID=6850 RepID=A0ABM1T757_LIMPO|nr:nephrin-like isoform X2 [Limulus polyphemus]
MGVFETPYTIVTTSILCALTSVICSCRAEEFGGQFTAVADGLALLPCNITIPRFQDAISLIMWYKGTSEVPIYTVDARKGTLRNALHLVADGLRPRAHFDITEHTPLLKIEPVRENDAGMYRCRVDFRWSRTMYQEARLNVVGNPMPTVTWWNDTDVVDDTFTVVNQDSIRNEFVIQNLRRENLFSEFTCQASNSNYTEPVTSTVILDMYLRPIAVEILSPKRPLAAGKSTQILCRSVGSRPAANIYWWKDRKKLTSSAIIAREGNYTISKLTFTPEMGDNGRYLSCLTENPLLHNTRMEQGWILNVRYVPEVTLKLGSNLQADTIVEGKDVYFECHVQANPWVDDIVWLHEGNPIRNKHNEGIIISNQSLVLQHIKITSRGKYQCIAYNSEGSGRSNEVEINLKFIPMCSDSREKDYRLARNESVTIPCVVDANPSDVEFYWNLNNSRELVDIHSFSVNGSRSELVYRPRGDNDYGVLLCWTRNTIGVQKEPCVFNIISVGRPRPLQNCVLFNISARGFSVRCKKGYDGGLTQRFHLEIYSSLKERVFSNMTQTISPTFLATNLPPSTSFTLVIYASNMKGKSVSVILTATTTPATQELKGDLNTPAISPTLAIIIGVVGTIVVLAIAILIFTRCHRRRNSTGQRKEGQKERQTPLHDCIDPNFSSKPKPDDLDSPTELSLGNGKIPRRRELSPYYGLPMEDSPIHNIKTTLQEGNRNLNYPLDTCGTVGWGTAMSSV